MIDLDMCRRGRDNLALTIMVPYDCDNNCKFCISKKEYGLNAPDKSKVIVAIRDFFTSYGGTLVKDVVITGGEPMQEIYTLAELIRAIPDRYDVYINTTFLDKNKDLFINFVNNSPKIKGVNISRHCIDYESDCGLMNGIADDESITLFQKPVKINCVVGNATKNIEKIVERWSAYQNVEVSFRADFTKVTKEELHNPFCAVNLFLNERYKFMRNTRCNVCDTTNFQTPSGMLVKYHKGLKTTSIRRDDYIEVNDFVITQNGKCYVDWDFDDSKLVGLRHNGNIIPPRFSYTPIFSYGGCGGGRLGGCGGGGC